MSCLLSLFRFTNRGMNKLLHCRWFSRVPEEGSLTSLTGHAAMWFIWFPIFIKDRVSSLKLLPAWIDWHYGSSEWKKKIFKKRRTSFLYPPQSCHLKGKSIQVRGGKCLSAVLWRIGIFQRWRSLPPLFPQCDFESLWESTNDECFYVVGRAGRQEKGRRAARGHWFWRPSAGTGLQAMSMWGGKAC